VEVEVIAHALPLADSAKSSADADMTLRGNRLIPPIPLWRPTSASPFRCRQPPVQIRHVKGTATWMAASVWPSRNSGWRCQWSSSPTGKA